MMVVANEIKWDQASIADSRNAPLRLDIAAKIAFPDGSMGAAGLRKERDAGRLVTELIAGKEFVTLAEIDRMREFCRGLRKARVSSGGTKAAKPTELYATEAAGSFATDKHSSALEAAKKAVRDMRTKKRSPNISLQNTNRRANEAANPMTLSMSI